MMSNWKFFIARRIYRSRKGGKEVSKPAIRIAMAGIAIGLAVMLVSVAVVIGFKHHVRDKVIGMGSDIVVSSIDGAQLYQMNPVVGNDSLLSVIRQIPEVSHVQRYSTKPGMIMTSDNFQGMIVKGVAQEYDWTYLKAHLQEGEIPVLTDSVASNRVLISRSMADKLSLKVDDKLYTYYIEDNVRARRLTVSGIFQTHFSSFDDYFLVTDMYTVNRLNGWEPDQVGGRGSGRIRLRRLEYGERCHPGAYSGPDRPLWGSVLLTYVGRTLSADFCLAGFARHKRVGYPDSDDWGSGLYHDFGLADYHSRTYADDWDSESAGG